MTFEKTVHLTSGRTLRSFLDGVFNEGIKSALAQRAMNEKEKQASAGKDVDSLFGGDGGGTEKSGDTEGGDQPEKPEASKTMDDETEKLKNSDVEVKDIVEKLNAIRSGKSFKDSAVKGAMEEWTNSLSKTERVALFAFLKGIASLVTGEVPGQEAEKPSSHPSDVKMDKTNEPHVVHKRPNVIAGPKTSDNKGGTVKKGADAEDTTPPAPITPKKR